MNTLVALLNELDFMQWLLVIMLASFMGLLLYCQMQKDEFDLRHLFVNPTTGKIDRDAFVFVGGWLVASWIMIYYASNLKLNEWWIALYMGLCMAPKLVAMFINAKFAGTATTAVETSSKTEITQEKTP